MADIDRFKHVNDTHGHDIGDEVLRIVGEALLANVRRDSLVARVGGDEFGLLLPRPARSIRPGSLPACASSWRPARSSWPVGMRGESSARWFARADAALYEAKRRGRSRISIARVL
jgi:GGDEF domain-containing protein